MKFTAIPLLFSLVGVSLAVPSQDSCNVLANYAQDQLRSLAPVLEHTVNNINPNSNTREVNDYLDAASDALTQINSATGPNSDQFRRELTQACGQSNSKSKKDAVSIAARQDAALVRQVYGSLAQVSRQTSQNGGGLDQILGGVVVTVGNLLNGVLGTVRDLLSNLGLVGLLGGLLQDIGDLLVNVL